MSAKHHFRFGVFGHGVYVALLWCTLIVSWHFPEYLFHYIAVLIFLGVFLRPIIEYTGVAAWWEHCWQRLGHKRRAKRDRQLRRKLDQQARDEKYRRARKPDPRLPKNW